MKEPLLSFDEFKENWENVVLHNTPEYIRKGQSLMNYLARVWFDEYENITSMDYHNEANIDCFFNDKLIPNTLKHLKKVWKNN